VKIPRSGVARDLASRHGENVPAAPRIPLGQEATLPAPTFTLTVLDLDTREVAHVPTFGTLAEAYSAIDSRRQSVRSVFTHEPQVGLVAFADGSRVSA
jgi:hypothetical protein